jgi:hypothetical protein
MSDKIIYLGMVEIMQRIIRVQTNAERLMKPTVSEEEMLRMLLDIETSAAWLREKHDTHGRGACRLCYFPTRARLGPAMSVQV